MLAHSTREELQRLARAHASFGPLSAVEEETPRSTALADADVPMPAVAADVPALSETARGASPAGDRDDLDEDSVDPMIAMYLA